MSSYAAQRAIIDVDNSLPATLVEGFMNECRRLDSISSMLDFFTSVAEGAGYRFTGYVYHPPVSGPRDEIARQHMSLSFPPDRVAALIGELDRLCDPISPTIMARSLPIRLSDFVAMPEMKPIIESSNVLRSHFQFLGEGIALPLFGPGGRVGCAILATGRHDVDITDFLMFRTWSYASWAHLRLCEHTVSEQREVILTSREREVLHCLARGGSNAEIADALGISPNTVATYLKRIFLKLDASDRVTASLRALAYRLIY